MPLLDREPTCVEVEASDVADDVVESFDGLGVGEEGGVDLLACLVVLDAGALELRAEALHHVADDAGLFGVDEQFVDGFVILSQSSRGGSSRSARASTLLRATASFTFR